jgi:hypothetical protein
MFVVVTVMGFVIRNKEATLIKTDKSKISLDSKKSKRRVVGTIELEPRRTSGPTSSKKKKSSSSKKKSSSSKKRR